MRVTKPTVLFSGIAIIMAVVLSMNACNQINDGKATKNPGFIKAKGTIAGRIIDKCTNAPVKGVKVSIAENGTVATTDNFGEFVFRNVPVNALDTPHGTLYNNSYVIIMDFTSYNRTLADTSALRYNNYEYVTVDVVFTDLNDGDNDGTGGDVGTGYDTPADGLVANVELLVGKLNTQINGQVVDMNYQPVSGAIVYLKKNLNYTGTFALLKQTTTDANGNYVFYNVEAGASVRIEATNTTRTMSGFRNLTLTCNQNSVLRTQVNVENLVLNYDDNINPFVINITPENNQDINPSGLAIVYTFSEPIKQTPYTRTDLGKGHNTIVDDIVVNFVGMKKIAAPMPFTASWNADMTQLTIVPTGPVQSARYSVNNFISIGSAKITDNANRPVVNNAAIIGDFEVLNFTTSGPATAPATPVVTRDTIMYPANLINWTGGNLKLRWSVDESAVSVKFFELYRKIGNGSFEYLADIRRLDTVMTIGTNMLVYGDPTNPRGGQSVQYRIRAISTNLVTGEFSTPIVITDRVRPALAGATVHTAGTSDYDYIYVRFSEPMNREAAETITNYSISNIGGGPANIRDIVYIGWDNVFPGGTGYKIRMTVNDASIVAGEVLTVTNVTDVSGNSIDTNFNTFTF